MKVRLSDGDIRLRLTEFEVASALEGRSITATVTHDLVVSLVPTDSERSSLGSDGVTHVVKVPASAIQSPSMVDPRMYESAPGSHPHILVEMDRNR